MRRLHVPARSAEQHRNTGSRACGADPRPGRLRCSLRAPRPVPRARCRCAARAARPPPLPARGAPAGGSTYTVKRGDTLSKIAQQTKPDNVSLEQMLVATVPQQRERVRRAQHESAAHRADRHRAASRPGRGGTGKARRRRWSERRRPTGELIATAWPHAAPATDADCSKAIGERQDHDGGRRQGERSAAGQDQLRVPRGSKGAARGSGLAEDLAAKDKALSEANSRVAELEKTVRDLQRRGRSSSNQTMSSTAGQRR